MPNLGPMEIGLIVVLVLLLFGASRLPKLGRSLGQSISGFKAGLREEPAGQENGDGTAGSDAQPD